MARKASSIMGCKAFGTASSSGPRSTSWKPPSRISRNRRTSARSSAASPASTSTSDPRKHVAKAIVMTRKYAVLVAVLQLLWVTSAAAQPVMFWFNDPVGPDETVLVTGAELDKITSVTVARIGEPGSMREAAPETSVPILQANPLSLKFVVPKEFAPGIYRFTLAYAEGTVGGRLNMPTVHWTQGNLGDAATPGGWLQVFGRNIIRQASRAQLLLLPEAGTTPTKAVLTKGDLWRGSFQIPDQIPPGRYR